MSAPDALKQYVLGFLFNRSLTKVVLVEKRRPKWQAGRLNGVGGAVEPSDHDLFDAIEREVDEEIGIEPALGLSWYCFSHSTNPRCSMHLFWAIWPEEEIPVEQKTDEPVIVADLVDLVWFGAGEEGLHVTVPNLRWELQQALAAIREYQAGRSIFFHAQTDDEHTKLAELAPKPKPEPESGAEVISLDSRRTRGGASWD